MRIARRRISLKRIYKILISFVSIALISCSAILVYAHPGGTDSNGGHYNRSTGEYHYHHGYPEHQHINGTCPYQFDDRTAENSRSGSSANSNTNNTTSRQTTSRTLQDEPQKTIDYEWLWPVLSFLWVGGLIFTFSAGFIADPKKNDVSEKRKKIANFVFNLGNIMIWGTIILVFVSAWLTRE